MMTLSLLGSAAIMCVIFLFKPAYVLFLVGNIALGLLTGLIQAYIFAILALVYIASATQTHDGQTSQRPEHGTKPTQAG